MKLNKEKNQFKYFKSKELLLSLALSTGILFSGCSTKVPATTNGGNTGSTSVSSSDSNINSDESLITDGNKEVEVRFSFNAISFDETTGVNTVEYIINDKKFIVDSADKQLEVVLEMLKQTVENGTFSAQEIWDETFYFSDYRDYENKGENNVILLEVDSNNGKMLNGYIEGTEITLPASDVKNALASIRHCISYNQNYEIAIQLGEYCQLVRKNQNIENAKDPFTYNEVVYDLSNPSSVRALCVAVVSEAFTDYLANAVLDYYSGRINREELDFAFANPRTPEIENKYNIFYSKFDNETSNIVDANGNDLLRYGYNDSTLVGNDGATVLEMVLLSKDGPIMVSDEASAIEALELLCKFQETQSYAMFFGDFDYFLLTQSAIRNQRDGANYDLNYDYNCEMNTFSINGTETEKQNSK